MAAWTTMMILISSQVFVLLNRVRAIDAALADCLDEAKRKDLLVEREIKHDVLTRLLDAAQVVKRRRGSHQ